MSDLVDECNCLDWSVDCQRLPFLCEASLVDGLLAADNFSGQLARDIPMRELKVGPVFQGRVLSYLWGGFHECIDKLNVTALLILLALASCAQSVLPWRTQFWRTTI